MRKAILTHIAGRLVNRPLMITPDMLEVILQVLAPRIGLGEPGIIDSPLAVTDFSRSPRYREYTGDGIGLIPVMGPLAYNLSFEDAVCSDIVSYREIQSMFREALADPLITAILFAFDSPGGEVSGVFDLADEIYAARSVKPIYAIVDEAAFSAAYALASSAGTIFIPRTGQAGSVGVIAQFVDQSAFDAKAGFKFTPVFAGERKNDFNPHEPLSDPARAKLQALVDEDYQLFVQTVARNRGLTVEAVIATQAAIYQGDGAIKAGLADRLMNFDQAVQFIESQTQSGGSSMKIFGRKAKVTPEAVTDEPEAVVDLDVILEKARAEGRAEGLAEAQAGAVREAVEAARSEELARIASIREKCAAVSALLPQGFAEQLIKDGVSIDAASDRITKAIADKSKAEAPEVTSTVGALGSGAPNPLLADAQRRAEAANKRGV